MLFPGAIYIIAVVVALFDMALCIILAFMVGSGAFYVARFFRDRTNDWQIHIRGGAGSDKWWFNLRSWAGSIMILSFIVFVYASAGPYFALIKRLGG